MNQKQLAVGIDETVGVVITILPDDDRATITAMSEPHLIDLHFGVGTWNRNNLGL